MFYVVYRKLSGYGSTFGIEEFDTESKALKFLSGMSKYRVVGVFKGQRLEPVMGKKRVVKRAISGLDTYKGEKEEND